MRSEYTANRALARNARNVRNGLVPRNRQGRILPARQGNLPGLNAWLIYNEVVAR